MSGKCDSIHSNNKNALTKLIGRPVIWSHDSQMTGDEIHLIGNNKTEQLDFESIKQCFFNTKRYHR